VTTSRPLLAVAAALAVLTSGCGGDDPPAANTPTKTVQVEMVDIAFKPVSVQVARGETLRFAFTNNGKVPHDAFIGDAAAQTEHEKQMRAAEGGGHGAHGGGDGDALTVEPGKTGELTHTFDKAGAVEIGCHQPGHYQAGMKVTVTVS
jgi:uncharacterized cupredoxin-like copper-binding protein